MILIESCALECSEYQSARNAREAWHVLHLHDDGLSARLASGSSRSEGPHFKSGLKRASNCIFSHYSGFRKIASFSDQTRDVRYRYGISFAIRIEHDIVVINLFSSLFHARSIA